MEPRPKPHLAGSRPRGPDCRGPSTPRALGDEAESAGVRGGTGQSWGWLESGAGCGKPTQGQPQLSPGCTLTWQARGDSLSINPFLQAAKLRSPRGLQNEPLRLWEACDSGAQWGADLGPLKAGELFRGFLTWGVLSPSPLDGPILE